MNRSDPSGHKYQETNSKQYSATLYGYTDSCTGVGGLPRAKLITAEHLHRYVDEKELFNCYGNAIGKQTTVLPNGYTPGDDVETAYNAVYKDLGGARNVRRLSSIDDPLNENEVLVAMHTGPEDVHFIIFTEIGWCNKSGYNPVVIIREEDVLADIWYPYDIDDDGNIITRTDHFYYDSEVIFFALRKDWWK